MSVELRPLDEPLLVALLDAAVAGAEPDDVMPPVEGRPGWTEARRAAFLTFHRSRSLGAADPTEQTFAIVADGAVVGGARLEPVEDAVEVGIWVARQARGRGIARAAARALVDMAEGPVVAETAAGNVAALGVLNGLGARVSEVAGSVHAELGVPAAR
ncbi:hypothetical protein GCM10009836_20090 [Pseudonocardia ailaonensis]|uniref:N-acetyltransferase domain-containing protein n=1 Tax=Pseudonocardia ailaonensis TaxID=367279 RepID=A0ABN2MVV6_9PSEU